MSQTPDDPVLSPWERRHQPPAQVPWPTLQDQIERAVRMGYRVISQTSTSVQLVRPKRFSASWMLVWTVLSFGTLFWVYPIYYLTKQDDQLYFRVEIPQP